MQIDQERFDWLVKNAGSVIRYRTTMEFLGESDKGRVESLKKSLLSDDLVQLWLSNLRPDFEKNTMHSGKACAFENAMGKLYEFGLRKGARVFDERTRPFRLWLEKQIHLPNEGYFPVFYRTLTAAFLSMTGYSNDPSVDEMIRKRLDTIFPFAKKGNLSNVYVPHDSFPSFPRCFRRYPLINPELYPNDEMKLPWIHDINAFLHSATIMEDGQLRGKVENIIAFILKPEYQQLYPGYGVIRKESGNYYAMGWSVHLPGYLKSSIEVRDFGRFLLLLNLLSRSRTAKDHPWFSRSLSQLERFKDENGFVALPHGFLPEKSFGYWVLGARMGLEAHRRANNAIKCESTFRYLEIVTRR